MREIYHELPSQDEGNVLLKDFTVISIIVSRISGQNETSMKATKTFSQIHDKNVDHIVGLYVHNKYFSSDETLIS